MSEMKKENLEDIINAVTSKEDVVMSLAESKRRARDRAEPLELRNPNEAIVSLLQILKNKKFQHFIDMHASPWRVMGWNFVYGILFLFGVVFGTFLLALFDKTNIISEVLTIFTRLLKRI
jgi:hypothetical protein